MDFGGVKHKGPKVPNDLIDLLERHRGARELPMSSVSSWGTGGGLVFPEFTDSTSMYGVVTYKDTG